MPSFEINEFIVLIIISIPVAFSPYLLMKRKDIMKWAPSYYALFVTFLSTNVEAFVAPDGFNFMEHFFAMLAGIFMCLAAFYEYYSKVLKEKQPKLAHKRGGMVEK
ncbi:MAG: hypothetical protein ACFFA0_15805 [Promethearchaeota archaeon]